MTETSVNLADLPELLKVREVGQVLRVSEQSVYAMLREGRIPSMRVGRNYLIPKHRLVKMIEAIGDEGE